MTDTLRGTFIRHRESRRLGTIQTVDAESRHAWIRWAGSDGVVKEQYDSLEIINAEDRGDGAGQPAQPFLGPLELPFPEALEDPYKRRFLELLIEVWKMVNKKGADYGDQDSLANLHASQRLGIAPWLGVVLRNNDKWNRIINLCDGHEPAVKDEGINDTLLDHAAYDILAYILREEAAGRSFGRN